MRTERVAWREHTQSPDNDMENESQLTLGIDLGGTKILVALVDEGGHVVASRRCPTRADRGFDGVVDGIVGCVGEIHEEAGRLAGAVGVGVAGQVAPGTGVVRFAPNLGWDDAPLGAALAERLGMPAVVLNDVRAATWGEWRHGAGRGVEDLVVLFVGTGVGGGVVSGGGMMNGCSNTAGELGHTTLVADGRACRCPNRGCLEAYVGGWAIAERAREAVAENPTAGRALVERAGSTADITAATVTEAWRAGDPLAGSLFDETSRYLAAGLVGVVNAFNPCMVVLGGGVMDAVPEYLAAVTEPVRARALEAATGELSVVAAELGPDAGAIGAAAFAREHAGVGV